MSQRAVSTVGRLASRQHRWRSSSLLLSHHQGSSHNHHHSSSSSNFQRLASMDMHTFALRRDDQRYNNSSVNHFHTSAPSESAVALIMGLTTLSAVGYAGSSAVKSYQEWQAAQPSPEEYEAQEKERQEEQATQDEESKKQEKEASKQPRENMFKEWFGVGVGAKWYEGGFEDTMTRREAALILGVRESSSAQRIKDAHRKLLVLNHPDTGGSTYIAGKTNEAKELLLKGKSKVKR